MSKVEFSLTAQTCAAQRVLVTGAARGLGLAIANHYAAAGARVAVCDVDNQALDALRQASPGLLVVNTDVAQSGAVTQLTATVQDQLGGLDVLVNNAAITGPFGPVEDNDPADWARTLQVNLVGQFNCIHSCVGMLKAAGGGSIVNISSVAGRLGYPLRTAYAASKWGIVGLTESLAMELGQFKIRVNAVLPGIIDNDRHRAQVKAQADALGISTDQMNARYFNTISLGEKVTEDDVAALVLFLTSPAGKNITGQSLGVCGNVETMRRR